MLLDGAVDNSRERKVVRSLLSGIVFRAALPADAYALAELSIMAGDGMYEFLLEDMAPREMLAGLVARSMKQDTGGSCWPHCFVADDKGVQGMINAFPAAWLRDQERDLLPEDRVQVLDPIDQAQDWDSYLINSVAVRRDQRRHGIAGQLVKWAIEQATVAGFARLSVNVWADNAAAAALFEKEGFRVQTRIEVPRHPRLSHLGGSWIMARNVKR
jgi:ribosomal protein S18 acetylase RimI-like enzyme